MTNRRREIIARKFPIWKESKLEDGRPNRYPALSYTEYEKIQLADYCWLCDERFIHRHEHPKQLTMDRLNPIRCYEWGNVVPVCRACNEAKSLFDAFFHDETIPWKTKRKLFDEARKYES